MKRIIIVAFAFMTAILPLMAQEQIDKLYQRMASEGKVTINRSIRVDGNPRANVPYKTSVCEINTFAIHKPDKKGTYVRKLGDHVRDIAEAIQAEASNPDCYRIVSYCWPNRTQRSQWKLIYGDDPSQYVTLGENPGKNYIFACFRDRLNPDYRWCYALEWWWYDQKQDIFGRYMKFYAKIPEK